MQDYWISETFYSIQGEGILAGVPSYFIRFAGCNLRCAWCDTPYASWNPEGDRKSKNDLLDGLLKSKAKYAVITGGEPMIAPALKDLITSIQSLQIHVTLETAGTISPGEIKVDLASISPKLSNSTPMNSPEWKDRHDKTRWRPDLFKDWTRDSIDYQLKFVIQSSSDLAEMEQWISETGIAVPAHKILLMPEGISSEALKQHALAIIPICKSRGYRFSPRLHVDLFGHTRGT